MPGGNAVATTRRQRKVMKEGDGEKPRQNVVVVAVVAVGFPVIVNSRNPFRTRWMVEPENFSACHGHKIIVFCFVLGRSLRHLVNLGRLVGMMMTFSPLRRSEFVISCRRLKQRNKSVRSFPSKGPFVWAHGDRQENPPNPPTVGFPFHRNVDGGYYIQSGRY